MFRTFARSIEVVEGEPLPTEFRLFKVGVNDTTKGPLLWDAKAASAVMGEYKRRGVRGVIDLNHDSIDEKTRLARKDAADAMGYFSLELRNGDLWMVDIRFNPEGEERLRTKKQAHFSPAVFHERENGRVVELLNVALVADPATLNAVQLIAASRELRRYAQAPAASDVQRALDAALQDKYPRDPSGATSSAYVCDVYPTDFVYDYDGGLFRVPYTFANGVATITGEPVRVMRQYVPVQAAALARARAYLRVARMR